jgi:hypothetical protein
VVGSPNLKTIQAILPEDFIPNSLINMNSSYTILKYVDADFSPEFGIWSVYCRLNDTRFYIDTDHMMQELERPFAQQVSLLIRVLGQGARISREEEPTIWLNVTCEDNFFTRKLKPIEFNQNSLVVQIEVIDSKMNVDSEWFSKEQFVFNVDENYVGPLGKLGTSSSVAWASEYRIEGSELARDHLKMNGDELKVEKAFDYELGEHVLNFTVRVHTVHVASGLKVSIIFILLL